MPGRTVQRAMKALEGGGEVGNVVRCGCGCILESLKVEKAREELVGERGREQPPASVISWLRARVSHSRKFMYIRSESLIYSEAEPKACNQVLDSCAGSMEELTFRSNLSSSPSSLCRRTDQPNPGQASAKIAHSTEGHLDQTADYDLTRPTHPGSLTTSPAPSRLLARNIR